ncbi:hypothetical protein [Ancylobacter sp. IITR112]|uniref:hypothetical protein n=1 Tax=Ancylobacter sp. IITR112 TaxID=3138073 RepID=UPI003529F5EC
MSLTFGANKKAAAFPVIMTWLTAALLMDAPFIGRRRCHPHHGVTESLGQIVRSWQDYNLIISFEAVSTLRKSI